MAETLELEIVTPNRRVLAERVAEVILPSEDGYLGVRPGHAPLLARLDVGEVSYRKDGEECFLALSGGFAEVLRSGVSILAQTCESADEIDKTRAEKAKERAERRITAEASDTNFDRAELSLKRALNRIGIAGRRRVR